MLECRNCGVDISNAVRDKQKEIARLDQEILRLQEQKEQLEEDLTALFDGFCDAYCMSNYNETKEVAPEC